jgi:FtsP/CotA-like multicopper oxidase with cupredoxin domain
MGDSQILNRQAIDGEDYHEALMLAREAGLPKPDLEPFLKESPQPPKGFEKGLKDTIRLPAMAVTRVAFRVGEYFGDSVWHCHILEHEDNDMMRPLIVEP